MIETFQLVLWLVGGYLAIQHLLAPLAVYFLNRLPCQYTLPEIDLATALAAANQQFGAAADRLSRLGFEPIVASRIAISQTSTEFVLFRKVGDPCVASISTSSNAMLTVGAVEFSQLYANGACLCLTSAPLPSIFHKLHMKQSFRLPGCADVADLYRRFAVIRERLNLGEVLNLPLGEELHALESHMNMELAELCRTGVVSSKCKDNARRLSLLSSYRMSWRLQWPWKQFLLSSARKQALFASGD